MIEKSCINKFVFHLRGELAHGYINKIHKIRVCEAIRIIRELIIVMIGTRITASADRTDATRFCIK